jgi:hypothetical protein
MALKKAKFTILGETQESFDCMYNPGEYEITYSQKYDSAEVSGTIQPKLQYKGPEIPTLSISLFFDTYMTNKPIDKKEDVRKYTDKILKAMSVDASKHHPPEVQIVWGSLDFKGVITSATHTFIMFLESGKPVRAKVKLTVMATETMEMQMKKTPLESPDRTKSRQVKQNESLWMLANQEYKDPQMWKVIAEANDVANPRKIKPGQSFKVPAIK